MKNIPQLDRLIVFKSRAKDIMLDASTEDKLSESCLTILRQRFNDPVWNYKPYVEEFSEAEKDFLTYWETENINTLPELLYQHGENLSQRLYARIAEENTPEWAWYHSVEQLLSLPVEKAISYRVPYRGVYLPTSYYLLLRRRENKNEGFYMLNWEK